MTASGTDSALKKAESKTVKKKTATPGTAFTFKENRAFGLDLYSVAIPDGFSYTEGENGAEPENAALIAWTPDTVTAEKWESGRITINTVASGKENSCPFSEAFGVFKAEVEADPGVKDNSKEIDCYQEDDGQFLYGYVRSKINGRRTVFHCVAGVEGKLKRFRLCFNTGLSQEKMERSAVEWIHKIQIRESDPVSEVPAVENASAPVTETVAAPEPPVDPRQEKLEAKRLELSKVDETLAGYIAKNEEAALQVEEAEKAYSRLLSDQLIEEESTKLQIRSLEAKSADIESVIADLKRRRRDVRTQKEEYRKTISNLEPERRAKSNEIARERKALEERLNLLADEKAEIQEEKADKKSKLQSVFLFKKKKQQEYDEVKSRLKEKNSEISACDEEIENLNARVMELKKNADKERVRLNKEIAVLDEQEKELRKSITAEEESIKKISKEISVLQEKIKNYKLSITNAANDLAECKKQCDLYGENISICRASRELILREIDQLEGASDE